MEEFLKEKLSRAIERHQTLMREVEEKVSESHNLIGKRDEVLQYIKGLQKDLKEYLEEMKNNVIA